MADAKGIGSPKKYQPYRCWDGADRERHYHSPNIDGPGDDEVLDPDMFADGYSLRKPPTRSNQLEQCRCCGAPLFQIRTDTGEIVRSRGQQPEYCSERCKLDVKNARRRAGRRQPTSGMVTDLNVIQIAGHGELAVSPTEWNRSIPRRMGRPQPDGLNDFDKLAVLGAVSKIRNRPRPKPLGNPADRVAKFRGFGTGGCVSPSLPDDWDQVTTWFRVVPRPARGSLKQTSDNVWSISL
ncbi:MULTISPECIES: hypothetical protein [unclassified Nocardia]|uniref:hypothetical protein n=1 Tax=unclassified Nocardia TaxID=2637762 RepID=UPI0033B0A522